MGAGYIGWKDSRFGFDSERIRNGIQNIMAHTWISPQPAFEMLSNSWNLFNQYQTSNKFTAW